jgi:hypothetical protein
MASEIVAGRGPCVTDPLTLTQFEELYRQIEIATDELGISKVETHIVMLTRRALIRFSTARDYIVRVKAERKLTKQDFRVVIRPRFEGNVDPITPRSFLCTEIRQNGPVLLVVSMLFLTILWLGGEISTVQAMNQMLVEANALFIGVFILFTVTQNKDLLMVRELTRRGFAHQMMQNDKYVAWTAILSLLTAFLSTGVAGAASHAVVNPLTGREVGFKSCAYVLTTVSIVLLADCLLSVTRYYMRLMQKALEGKMYRDLMGRGQRETDCTGDKSSPDSNRSMADTR